MFGNFLEIVVYKAYADLRAEAQRTYLGTLWWVIEPMLDMSIYYIAFSVLLNRGTEHFVAFLLIGTVTVKWFNTTVMSGSNSIYANAQLIRRTPLPKTLFPLSLILRHSVQFFLALVMLLGFLWLYGFGIQIHYSVLPLLLLTELLLITGVMLPLSALVPLFPDLTTGIRHFLRLTLFMSGIFYSQETIPEKYHTYFYLNPLAVIIRSYRDVLMYETWPVYWLRLMFIAGLSVLGILLGLFLASRFDLVYAKRIEK